MNDPVKPADLPFLSRWSKHKTAAVTGATEPVADARGAPTENINTSSGAALEAKIPQTPRPEPISSAELDADALPPAKPELPPIDSLTHESDFTGFMAKEVDPGLRNQAMKKLFTNPHYQFEQMDKLDIYIDDYSKPDPIPPEMLRSMYQSKSLFLFDDEEKVDTKEKAALTAAESAESLAVQDTPAIEPTAQVSTVDEQSDTRSDLEIVASPEKVIPNASSTGVLNKDLPVPAHTAPLKIPQTPQPPQSLSATDIKNDS